MAAQNVDEWDSDSDIVYRDMDLAMQGVTFDVGRTNKDKIFHQVSVSERQILDTLGRYKL